MRNPAKSVRRLAGWEPMGWRLSRLLNDEARRSPALLQALGRMASEKEREAAIPVLETELQQSGARLAQAIAQDLGHPDVAGVVGPTGWRWQLLEIILTQAGDPDIDVAQWLRGRTPLGVLTEITPRGIFPNTEQTAAQAASWEFYQQRTRDDVEGNYTSYKEHPDESAGELRRLVAAGHVEEIGTWADVKARWPNALATKLATLVKVRADGSSKVRFVVDMRRSGINGLSKCRERITLPRGEDVIRDVLALVAGQGTGEHVELLTVDIADAFLNLHVGEAERGYAVITDEKGTYYSYRGVPFGLATAPLLWGRLAAAMSRYAQACHWESQHRLQTYVDDPIIICAGTKAERTQTLACTLAWAAIGVGLALHKLHRGPTVPWIGVEFKITRRGLQVTFDKARIRKLLDTIHNMINKPGLVYGLRPLTGELAWMAGFVPRARPWVTMLWGAITETDRAAAKHPRPAGAVLRPLVIKPLTWLRAFLTGHHGGLVQNYSVDQPRQPTYVIRTDASTTGMGGILKACLAICSFCLAYLFFPLLYFWV